jgi:hypothetical protein
MKKIFSVVFLIFTGTLQSIAQPLPEIRIVSEDQRSVVLEFTPQIKTEQVLGNHGTVFTRFRFFGSQVEYDSIGMAIFFRPVLMLLPSAEYSLQVISSEFQMRDAIKLLPKPTVKFLEDFGVSESYDESDYYRMEGFPKQNAIAELTQVGKTSLGYIGTLILRPIQMVDQERFKVFTRILVRLEFKKSFPPGILSTSLLKGETPKKTRLEKFTKISSRQIALENSPLALGEWYKIEIEETGMYKLDYNYFHNQNIVVNDINSIRLYGNGGIAIPDSPDTNTYPRPNTLLEIPCLIVDENFDGVFNQDDYVVFYGRGVRRWIYNGGGSFQHIIHPYTKKNYYFFTFNQGIGRGMDTISGLKNNPDIDSLSNFQEKIFVEQERYNLLNSGRKWVGKLFSGTDNIDTYYNSLPGLVDSLAIRYRFNFLHRSVSVDYLNIYENGQRLYGPMLLPRRTSLTDDIMKSYADNVIANATRNGGVPNDASVVRIQIENSSQDSKTWLDSFEIFYQRRFEAGGNEDVLLFTTADLNGSVLYRVANLSSEIRAFDVTIHDSVKQITQLEFDPLCTFQLQQQSGKIREIAVVGKNGYKIPPAALRIDNSNLHGVQTPVNFIIISPKEFIPEANRLKSLRESHDSLYTIVVDIDQIFNEFSGGIPDPLAIREFLRYTQNNWIYITPTMDTICPGYVLLFGWGHYDFKNWTTSQRNWIPPYEPEESLVLNTSYPCDDQFVILDSSNLPAIPIGRLPARSLNEAAVIVNKIISYETTASVDPWRNRITYVADDGKTSYGDDGNQYTIPSENLAEIHTSKNFEKIKIYIVEYPTVNGASGRRKPDANKAIVDMMNTGTLITNFIGHGSSRLWAHEAIFTREDDLPKLTNRDRLTFVVAATCSYGLYDDFKERSAAEQLITMEQGGAIAGVSAARAVYNDRNVSLNTSLYDNLLRKNTDGDYRRLGDAWLLAKRSNYSAYIRDNTRKFHLFGDPTLRLLAPRDSVSIDSVDGRSLNDSTVVIEALGHINIAGTMQQKDGSPMTSFNGKGLLRLFDSKKDISIHEGIWDYNFSVNGSQLYSGEVSINSGQFSATIPIPKDVTFGKNARMSIYTSNDQTDGVGYTENIMISGVDTTAAIDTVGPYVSIYLDDYSFRTGNVVKSNPILIVRLEDESGINTSTIGVGHQLSATISNPERNIDLSSYYHSFRDTYKSGEARYQMNDLIDGKYTLRVKAWDIQNNSSEAEIFFEVSATDDLVMLNVLNYPNPFSNSTTFTFQRNTTELIDVEVKIYTVTGRLIYILKKNTTERFVKIPWDGRDNEGSYLANGIYFYKLIVSSQINQRSCETIGKMAVVH